MPENKRLLFPAACFLLFLCLGFYWANSDPTALSAGQRLLISAVLGLVISAAWYFLSRQGAPPGENSQTERQPGLDREEFAADLSHEIRTPLSGILGVMYLLKRTQLDRNQQRYVDMATNSANMLLMIINDALDIFLSKHPIGFSRYQPMGCIDRNKIECIIDNDHLKTLKMDYKYR